MEIFRIISAAYLTTVGYNSPVKLYTTANDAATIAFPIKASTTPVDTKPVKEMRFTHKEIA